MWIFILEAALALALLAFIVWWTMAPVHKRETKDKRPNELSDVIASSDNTEKSGAARSSNRTTDRSVD